AHLPNTEIARYHLLPGLVFLLLLSELWAILQTRGPVARGLATIALVLFILGNADALRKFYAAGRGDVVHMLTTIAEQGQGPITSNTELRDRPVLDYYMPRLGVTGPLVGFGEVCKTPPRWILATDLHPEMADEVWIGTECSLHFRKVMHYEWW